MWRGDEKSTRKLVDEIEGATVAAASVLRCRDDVRRRAGAGAGRDLAKRASNCARRSDGCDLFGVRPVTDV